MKIGEKDLIKKAKNGDISSLETLLKETEKDIYASLYYLTDTEVEFGDIVQESLLKISKNIKKLKDDLSYKAWVNKIVLREYYNFLRKKRNKCKKIAEGDICEICDDYAFEDKKRAPIDDCIGQEVMSALKNSICKLNAPYREAIVMREFAELTYDEIARITNTNIGTVKSRIARARNRLKEYMKGYIE